MDPDDIVLIKSRKTQNENISPSNAVWLFITNAECQAYNKQIHNK